MITTKKLTGGFIKIDVKDNNVEQAIRVLKENYKKRVFQGNEDEKHLRKTI